MRQQLTPGRWRGLKATSLQDVNVFAILAFDQRGSYRRMMPEGTTYDTLVALKREIVGMLSQYASGVLLDPIYGLNPAMHMSGKSGLIMALEKSGYSGDSTYRRPEFIDSWTAEKIRRMGANAVKLLVYYNPQASDLAQELEDLIRDVTAKCHAVDLPIFLEPVAYSMDATNSKDSEAFARQRPEIVVETARRLSQTGVDVLKMEFPVDIQYETHKTVWHRHLKSVSDVATVPWVLLSAGVDFDKFEEQAIAACESGASGFLAGRAIWKEAVLMDDVTRAEFLAGPATRRIQRLCEIARANARPWSQFYSPPPSTENWFESY